MLRVLDTLLGVEILTRWTVPDELEKALAALTRAATLIVLLMATRGFLLFAFVHSGSSAVLYLWPILAVLTIIVANVFIALGRIYKVIESTSYSTTYKYFLFTLTWLFIISAVIGLATVGMIQSFRF